MENFRGGNRLRGPKTEQRPQTAEQTVPKKSCACDHFVSVLPDSGACVGGRSAESSGFAPQDIQVKKQTTTPVAQM
jgi:hypothetical protein